MKELFLLFSMLFIFVWAWLDRFKEVINFESWWENSVFRGLEEKYPRVYKWLRSYDKDEINYLKIGKSFKIRLHPIFKDGYHFAKNLIVLFYLLIIAYQFGIPFFFAGAFLWWVVQNISVKLMVKNYIGERL